MYDLLTGGYVETNGTGADSLDGRVGHAGEQGHSAQLVFVRIHHEAVPGIGNGPGASRPDRRDRCVSEVLDDSAYVAFRAGRVEDAEPGGVAAGQAGTRDERSAAAFQGVDEGHSATLRLGLVAAGPLPPEADDPECRRRHERELGMAADQSLGELRQLEIALDGGAECSKAEGLH